jgi:rubrerythrin
MDKPILSKRERDKELAKDRSKGLAEELGKAVKGERKDREKYLKLAKHPKLREGEKAALVNIAIQEGRHGKKDKKILQRVVYTAVEKAAEKKEAKQAKKLSKKEKEAMIKEEKERKAALHKRVIGREMKALEGVWQNAIDQGKVEDANIVANELKSLGAKKERIETSA